MSRGRLTHFDARGQAHLVDVGAKGVTLRAAVASGCIQMQPATLARLVGGTAAKGDVLGVARIAAIQAAKNAVGLIPLAHPLALTRVAVAFDIERKTCIVRLSARVECRGRTGVEMEALCAVAVGLLTIYDMLKAVDRGMTMGEIRLEEKSGGRSGLWKRRRNPVVRTRR